MKFVPMHQLLRQAMAEGYGIPSFCTWNAESMKIILNLAAELKAPVILMNGPGEFGLFGPRELGAIAHALAQHFEVKAALHLDHGNSLEQVEASLAANYSSVMLDYSLRPFEENVEALRRVVGLAHPRGVSVEGELGVIGRVDSVSMEGGSGSESTLTDPEVAADFVEKTGVDALAVSIGNAHGRYTKLPHFDFERLAKIKAATGIPLVLHGGSGTPEADLRRAISLGIAKINVATEIVSTIRESLQAQWNSEKDLWPPMAEAIAMKAMTKVAEKWFHLTGAVGRA